ncbi:MAG: hypothetical protein ACR2M0_09890 [Chloroflexia bacterium]
MALQYAVRPAMSSPLPDIRSQLAVPPRPCTAAVPAALRPYTAAVPPSHPPHLIRAFVAPHSWTPRPQPRTPHWTFAPQTAPDGRRTPVRP